MNPFLVDRNGLLDVCGGVLGRRELSKDPCEHLGGDVVLFAFHRPQGSRGQQVGERFPPAAVGAGNFGAES